MTVLQDLCKSIDCFVRMKDETVWGSPVDSNSLSKGPILGASIATNYREYFRYGEAFFDKT